MELLTHIQISTINSILHPHAFLMTPKETQTILLYPIPTTDNFSKFVVSLSLTNLFQLM